MKGIADDVNTSADLGPTIFKFTAKTLGGRMPTHPIPVAEVVVDYLSIFDGYEDPRTTATVGDVTNLASRSSYYLVCNRSIKLAKVGQSHNLSYEECSRKYCRIYGHLDDFHFIQVENGESLLIHRYSSALYMCITPVLSIPGMNASRLERAFNCFFQDTRLHAGKEFFSPTDGSGRDMVPLYVDILQLLASSDVQKIRLFYLEHGLSIHSARAWIQSRHNCTVVTLDEPLQTSSTIEVNSSDAIINTAMISSEELQTYREQRLVQHNNSSKNTLLEPDFIDGILSDISSEGPGASLHHHSTIKLSNPPLPLYLYLVYCDRSNAVKVSASDQSYDVSVNKFKKIYGHLTSFHYVAIKNGE